MLKNWLIAATLLPLTAVPLPGQTGQTGVTRPRLQLQGLKGVARRPLAEQLQPFHQGYLQNWFLDNVEFFYRYYDDLDIARHPNFRLGTTTPFLRLLAPPRGGARTGTSPLFLRFSDVDAGGDPLRNPTTEEPYIWFPRNNITISGGVVNTCWHEMMHAILDGENLKGQEKDCPRTWNGNFDQERQEHLYIENVQNQLDWYETLRFFEREVRKAAAETRKVLTAQRQWSGSASVTFTPSVPIISFDRLNYDLERQLFAASHKLWFNSLQQRTLERTCWLSDKLVEELDRIAGIRLPTPDEVIAHYMAGGIRDEHGVPVRVPEWVFVPEPDQLREIVYIGLGDVKKEVKGDEELHSYKLNVSEFYRRPPGVRTATPHAYVGSRPVTRGVVSIELRDSDRYAGLHVRLIDASGVTIRDLTSAGGATRGGYFEVDLLKEKAVLEQGGSLEVTASFVEKQKLTQDHTYIIDNRYRDQAYPTVVPSHPIYVPVARQLWLKVKKGGAATPQAPKSKIPGPPAAAAQGPAWELLKVEAERGDLSSPDADYRFNSSGYKSCYRPGHASSALIGRGSASTTFNGWHKREKKLHGMNVEATWDDPGDRLPPGVHDYVLQLTEKAGALNNFDTGVRVSCEWFFGTPPILYMFGNSHVNPQLAATYHGYCSLALGRPPASEQDDYHPDIPVGSPGEVVLFVVDLSTEVSAAKLSMTYGWVPDDGGGSVIIDVDIPPPPPEPPWDGKLDNIPDEGPYVPPPQPEPSTGVPVRWFYHAEQGYRLPLPVEWAVHELPEDDVDFLVPPDESLLLSCGRGHSVLGDGEDSRAALARLANTLLGDLSGAQRTDLVLGRGRAVQVEHYDPEERQSFVHIYAYYDEWLFYLSLMSPPGEGRFAFPREVQEMLRKIDFIDRE
jgi:hypothetical protein